MRVRRIAEGENIVGDYAGVRILNKYGPNAASVMHFLTTLILSNLASKKAKESMPATTDLSESPLVNRLIAEQCEGGECAN